MYELWMIAYLATQARLPTVLPIKERFAYEEDCEAHAKAVLAKIKAHKKKGTPSLTFEHECHSSFTYRT